jgi:hypothetical protein
MKLLALINDAVRNSMDSIRAEISNVRWGPIMDNRDTIIFEFRGKTFISDLNGRTANFFVTDDIVLNQKLAVMTILDGNSREYRLTK